MMRGIELRTLDLFPAFCLGKHVPHPQQSKCERGMSPYLSLSISLSYPDTSESAQASDRDSASVVRPPISPPKSQSG